MGIGATTLRRMITDGRIPVMRLDGKFLLLERDIEMYLQEHYGRIEVVKHTPRQTVVPKGLLTADVLVKA